MPVHPIVYISPVEWNSLRQRPQVIMEHFCKYAPVFYVNPVGLRSIRLSDAGRIVSRFRSWLNPSLSDERPENISVVSPVFVPLTGARGINRFLYGRFMNAVESRLRSMGGAQPILWIGVPSQLAVYCMERMTSSVVLYDCMDDFPGFHKKSQRITEDEDHIIQRADLVFAASKKLYDKVAARSRDVRLAPNGVDLDCFRHTYESRIRPADLPDGETLIGYHGTIGDWVDLRLITTTAKIRPDWRFVLIGPWTASDSMRSMPDNVYYLGSKPQQALADYLAFFDVGIVPFTETSVAYHANPIKVYEYLAMGLPVVSTPIAELASLRDMVRIASGPDQFFSAIEEALGGVPSRETIDRRLAVARKTSWENVVRGMEYALIDRGIAFTGQPNHPGGTG